MAVLLVVTYLETAYSHRLRPAAGLIYTRKYANESMSDNIHFPVWLLIGTEGSRRGGGGAVLGVRTQPWLS